MLDASTTNLVYSKPFRNFLTELLSERLRAFNVKLQNEKVFQDVREQVLFFVNSNILKRALNSEYQIALKAGLVIDLQGFYDLTSDVEYCDYFWGKYTHAKTIILEVLSNIDRHLVFAITQFEKDRERLRNVFNITDKPIDQLKILNGDLHKQNSFSILFRFDDELVWFKPKNIYCEVWFYNFIRSINSNAKYEINYFFPNYISEEEYSWVGHITHSIDDVSPERYYFTFGQYLAFFYLFGTYDIINDNVICHKGAPVFFDLETLLNQRISPEYETYTFKSVLDIGVLPSRLIPSITKEEGFNGAIIPRNNKIYTKSFVSNEKNELRQMETLTEFPLGALVQAHLPFNVEKDKWKSSYSQNFISGFTHCFENFILKNKSFIVGQLGDLFKQRLKIRKLIRHCRLPPIKTA